MKIELTPPNNQSGNQPTVQANNNLNIKLVPPSELGGTSSILSSSLESFEDPTKLGFQPRTGIDNIDLRARSQSTADKWGNGAVKMLGTAATSFAEPFVDLTVGVAQALGTGKISGIYDNVVTQQFDNFNEYLQKEFPNYYTKAEEEAGVLESLGTANFWADKALNGAGYLLGAIGSGVLTGGLGLGTRATGATKILQGLGKEFSAAKKGIDLANLTAKEARLIRAGRALDNLTASTVGAIGESGMEARSIKDNTLKSLTQLRNSGDPRYAEMSDEDIINTAEAAGNTGFALNMAIVGTSNFLQFGKLFKNNYSAERQIFGNIVKDAETGLYKAATPSKISRIAASLASPLEEMAQEGLQFTTEKGIDGYIKNKYNPSQGVVFKDLVDATLNGLEETLTTKEGQESMLLGAILGGVGSVTKIGDYSKKQEATKVAANILNKYKSSDSLKPLVNSIIAHGSYQAAMDDAIKKGDPFNYKNAEFGQFFTYVQSRIATDKYDILQDELTEAASLNKEDFEKAYGVTIPAGKTPASIVNELKQSAEKIKKITEDVNTRFSTVNPQAKDALIYAISSTENLNKRERALNTEVFAVSGIDYLDIKNTKNKELQKEYKNILEDQLNFLKKDNPIAYDQVISKIKDLERIDAAKQILLNDYRELSTEEGQNRIQKKVEKAEKKVEKTVAEEVKKETQPVTTPQPAATTTTTPSTEEEFDSSQETLGKQVDIESLTDEQRAAYGLPPKEVVKEQPKVTLSEDLEQQKQKELDSLENAYEDEQISEEEYIKRSKEIDDKYNAILLETAAGLIEKQESLKQELKSEEKQANTIIPNKEEFNRTKFFTKFEAKEQEEADKILAEISNEELANNLSIEITPNPFLDKSKPIDKGNGVFYNAPKFTVKVYYKGTFLGHLPNPNMYTDANGNVISSTELAKLNGNLSKAELDYLAAQQEALQAFYTFVEQNNITKVDAQLLKDLNVSISKTTGNLAIVPKDQVQETTLDKLKVDYLDITNGQYIIIDRSDVYEGGKVLGNITSEMYNKLGIKDVYEMLTGVPENFPRYVVAIPNANGTITYVPIRPKEITKENKADIFNVILAAAKEFKANKPSETATHNFEKTLDQQLFIALPKAETHISVSVNGDPYVKIKLDGAKRSVKVFVPTGTPIGETFDEFINNIQKAIETQTKYESLKKAGVNLKPENIKLSIPKETKTTDKSFASKFITATTPIPTVNKKVLISFDKQILEDNTVASTTKTIATPTVVTPISNIATKKTEIEKRRQEDLKQLTKTVVYGTNENGEIDENITLTIEKGEPIQLDDIENKDVIIISNGKYVGRAKRNSKGLWNYKIGAGGMFDLNDQELFEQFQRQKIRNGNIISTFKYNAELAALEGKPTEEVVTPLSVEEIAAQLPDLNKYRFADIISMVDGLIRGKGTIGSPIQIGILGNKAKPGFYTFKNVLSAVRRKISENNVDTVINRLRNNYPEGTEEIENRVKNEILERKKRNITPKVEPIVTTPQTKLTAEEQIELDNLLVKVILGTFTEEEVLRYEELYKKNQRNQKVDPETPLFSIGTTTETGNLNIEKAKEWVKSVLPETVAVEELNGLFNNIVKHGTTFGAFMDNVIYLSSKAPLGTEYHEAFHAVFRLLSTDSEIKTYLNIAKREKGKVSASELKEFKEAATNRANLTAQELEDLYYEEYLAEKFKNWMKSKTSGSLLNKLFKKIANWIKEILGRKTELDTLFADISTGKFRTAVPVVNRFTNRNMDPAFALVPNGIIEENGVKDYSYANPEFTKVLINTIGAKVFKIYTSKDNTLSKKEIVDKLIKEEAAKYDMKALLPRLATVPVNQKGNIIQQALKRQYMLTEVIPSTIIKEQVNKAIKLFDFKEDVDDNTYDGSEGKTERFDVEAWSIGGFGSVNSIAKQYLGFTTYMTVNEITGLEEEVAVDSNKLYNGVLRALASTNEKNMLNRLSQYSQDVPNAKALFQRMVNDFGIVEDQKGNLIPTKRISEYKSVINAFKKEKVDYIAIVVDPKTRQIKIYPANQRDTKKIQVEQWGTKYLTLSRLEDAKKTMDKALFNAFQVFNNTAPRTASQLDNDALVLQKELEKIGVKLSIGLLRYSINSFTFNSTDVLGSNLTPEQLKNYNTFSDIVPLTKQDIEAIRNIIAKGNSPFESLTEEDTAAIGRLEKIAESNAIFDETVGTSNFQNAEGKQVFQIINSSLALEVTRELNNPEYRKLLMDNFFMSENLLLNHPLADEIFSGLRIALLDGIRETSITVQGEEGFNKKAGTTFGSYDGRSYLLTSHGLFLEQFNAQNSIKVDGKIVGKTALYNIAQNEASNTAYLVKLPVEEYYTTQGITDKALQDLTSLVGQEFNRINKRNQEIAEGVNPIKDIHDGKLRGLKFWNFAWLETASPNLNAFLIKEAKEGVPFAETLKKEVGGKNIQNVLNALLKDHFNKEIAKHKEILKEEGILTPTMNLFPGTRTDKTGIFNEKYDGNIDHYLGDFLLNDYINSTSFNQFIDGDPSTRKNAIDYVKRNKSRMASGPNMGEGNHTVAYIKDIEKPIYTDTLENVIGEPIEGRETAKINTADAQSYISLNHRVNQLKAWGKYSPVVEAIYNKLIAGEKLSWEDTQTLIKNDAGLNSIKSVTAGFTINDNEVENFDTEVYHKLSEFTLTRGITSYKDKDGNWKAIKGREYWHNLLNEMDKHSIDQVIYESGSKLATTNPVSAVDGKYDLSKSFVKVPNKYKRLQVETPSNKLKITAGTQLLQLIDSEQTDNTEVEYLGKKTTIGELRKEYQKLLALTRGNSVRNVMSTLFKENGDPDLRKAAERFLNTLEDSGADISLLEFFSTKANGDPKYNWNLPSVIDKFEQLFLSQFGSGVLAQKVPGFKLSLVSGAGFNIIREKATGKIIRTDEYLASEDKAKYDTDAYETTELKHNVVDPKTGKLYSEVVIPSHFQFMYNLQPGDEIPSNLFSMLGYRIPTQEKHSMMSIRVVDVLPAEYGSIVIAPKEIVYLSGADFDIDSLFVQRPDFYINKDGKPVVFGTAKTDVEKFAEYVEYQKLYNIDFAKLINERGEQFTPTILKELGLPSNYKQLKEKNNKYGEQNNSVNNNNILAIQLEMLTNKAISEKIAKTPATMTALANEADFINALQKVTEESTSDVHSINGKYEAHKNNSTGKSNIGPAANGNLINALLTKENVKLEDGIFAFKIDDKEYNTFGDTLDGAGNRKNDTLSTVLSAMTDNAKERLAARLNLSLDMLNTVIYMISLGTPLKQVMLFVNQPIIKEYAALRNTSNYTIKTDQDPQNQFVVDSMIEEKYKLPPSNLFSPDEDGFTTEELITNIKENKFDREVLGQFLLLQKQSAYYFKVANIIKINKGLGTSFDDLNKIVESIKELGVEGILDSTENLDNIKTWSSLPKGVPFDIREAVLKTQSKENLEYLNSILKASEKLVLTQSNTFKRIYSVAKRVLKTRLSGRAQVELDMKRDLLGFLSIKAYKQLLSKSSNPEDIKRLNSLSDTLLYPELGGKTLAEQLVEIKNSDNKEIATNPLVEYLTPLFKYSAPNIPNRNNKYGLDIVTGRQRIRENTQYIEELIDGYKALYANKETRDFALNLFNYLLIKDGARFRDKSFVKYLAPFVFTQVSKGLDIVVEDFAKGTSDTINSLGIDAGKAMTEFIEIYARYKFNERNITKVEYFLDAPTTEVSPEDPNSITYNLFKGYDKNKSKEDNKKRMDINIAFLEKFFNPDLSIPNRVSFEFPLFVKINGQIYKLVALDNKPDLLTRETTIPQGTSAKYTLVTTMGRKGELPYSRTVQESEKLNQAILKTEVAPVITVEREEGEEDYYEGYEENTPAELGDNFDENYEEEKYYDDSSIEDAEDAFDRSEGGYELQWPTQLSTNGKVIPLNESQRFTRESVEKDTDYMYLFTDNAGRTSGSGVINPNSWYAKKYGTDKKYPSKTQAVARGLENVYPITTMVDDKRTQWTDAQFDTYKKIIDDEIETIKQASKKYKGIKFSAEMPFGKGAISNMKETAPKIWNYLNTKLAEIGIDNTGNIPTVIITQPQTVTSSSLVDKAKGIMNTLFATKEKITTFAITESELAVINENIKKAGFSGSYTMEKFNSLTKEQQEIVKKCYGR